MLSPIKILIADDEEILLEIMVNKISAQGYQVITAKDGQAAWDQIISQSPDVIVLDVTMPKMDGWEVLSRLRTENPSKKWQPVIIVSAETDISKINKGFALEADHYLIKPCRIEDILKSIKLMLALLPQRQNHNP